MGSRHCRARGWLEHPGPRHLQLDRRSRPRRTRRPLHTRQRRKRRHRYLHRRPALGGYRNPRPPPRSPHAQFLTFNGPGRAHNGNSRASEITVNAAPAGRPTAPKTSKSRGQKPPSNRRLPHRSRLDGDPSPAGPSSTGATPTRTAPPNSPFESPPDSTAEPSLPSPSTSATAMYNLAASGSLLTTNDPENILYPDDVVAALQTPAADRSAEQIKTLLDYHGQNDETYVKLAGELRDLQNNPPKPILHRHAPIARTPIPCHLRPQPRRLPPARRRRRAAHPRRATPLQPRGKRQTASTSHAGSWTPPTSLTARVAVNRVWEHLRRRARPHQRRLRHTHRRPHPPRIARLARRKLH